MRPSLIQITFYFLRLGVLGFGGPLSVLAIFQKDLVQKQKWITQERFTQAVAFIKALPGPTSTQLAVYLGQAKSGRIGGLISGTCFIFPSFLMMVLLAYFYERVKAVPASQNFFFGMQAAAFGVILQSVLQLALPYRKNVGFWIFAVLAFVLTLSRPSMEPLIILGSGTLSALLFWQKPKVKKFTKHFYSFCPQVLLALPVMVKTSLPFLGISSPLLLLCLTCLKAGAFVFGTGLAIVPLLSHTVVSKYHWLTNQEFLDALAFGQITPGPVVITVTFVGYRVAGLIGAVIATMCIFAPSFFNMLTWFPIVERKLEGKQIVREFVLGAIAAVVGSILVALSALVLKENTNLFVFIGISALGFLVVQFTRFPVWATIPSFGFAYSLIVKLSGL